VHEAPGGPLQTLIALINPLLGPLATTTIIIVFVIFILIQREDLRNRLIRLAGSTDTPHTTAALDDAAHRLSQLFLTQLAINSGFGAAIGLGLLWLGVPSPFVWGVLAGVLRFVPFVGPVLGLIFPLILAVSIGTGWSMALWTIALFVVLEGVTGQVIEPVFEGRTTGLTPIAIVVAATFWAWLWGPVGLVLATPLTVIRQQLAMKTSMTWSPAAGLNVVSVEPGEQAWTVTVDSQQSTFCPGCGTQSESRHSTYRRTLRDLSAQGAPVVVNARLGRWRCRNQQCDRRIFVERVPGFAAPFARRTARLAEIVRLLGHSADGRPSERLMRRLGMPVSDTTILASPMKHARVRPEGSAAAVVRVAGVDDWAWRKGHKYGTIIVDLERRAVVDVLADRRR
jgi:hypothetical protein